jgi:hypothetical protein
MFSDNVGNQYDVSLPYDDGAWTHHLAVAHDVNGGAVSVTVDLKAREGYGLKMYIHEYAGLAAAPPEAKTGQVTDTCPVNASDCMASGVMNGSAGWHLLFGYGFSFSGGVDAGTDFAVRSKFHDNLTEDRIVLGPGPFQSTATATKNSGSTVMLGALLRGQ